MQPRPRAADGSAPFRSAPELAELESLRAILGTRDEVLACIKLQAAWRRNHPTPPPRALRPQDAESIERAAAVARLVACLRKQGNDLGTRQSAVHSLATMAAQAQSSPAMIGGLLTALTAHSPCSPLAQFAIESETLGDALSLQLVLSLVANLAFVGLAADLAAQLQLPRLVARMVLACDADAALRPYALAAAYNLAYEEPVLSALLDEREALLPLLEALEAEEGAARRAKQAKHARGTRENVVAYAARQRALHGSGGGAAVGASPIRGRGLQQPLLVGGQSPAQRSPSPTWSMSQPC